MMDIDVPAGWEKSFERILRERLRKILVLGAVDMGKSAYCRFLCRRMAERGVKAAVVDSDIGQKDIGPPAAITMGYFSGSEGLCAIDPASFYFVGAVNPAKHLLPMVLGTSRMVESAKAPFIIINTTGMIHGLGRILKSYKIEAVKPDVIVGIQKGYELKSLLKSQRINRIVTLSPAPMASAKSLEQRRAAREKAFQRYFSGSLLLSLNVDSIVFQRTSLFSGKPIEDPDLIYRERTSEGDIIVVGNGGKSLEDSFRAIQEGFERGLLCGAADRNGLGLGLAIIEGIDFRRKVISLWTPVRADRIRVIQLGDIYVGRDGKEMDRKKPGAI